MKSLLDPSFQYVPSIRTDIRKTFARIRREQRSRTSLQMKPEATLAPIFTLAKRATK
jgi:hypothetical protein